MYYTLQTPEYSASLESHAHKSVLSAFAEKVTRWTKLILMQAINWC